VYSAKVIAASVEASVRTEALWLLQFPGSLDQFTEALAEFVDVLPNGSLDIERVQLAPLFAADDDVLGHLLRGDVDPATGLGADPTPPFALYPANLNHIGPPGNPFAALGGSQ
jgi:hypothetical protein